MMSASAPAGKASKNTGSEVAACTRATMRGEGASDVISQAAPTSRIQVPVLEARLAIHSRRKTEWRKGLQREGCVSETAVLDAPLMELQSINC
jgi:hypothetical protein